MPRVGAGARICHFGGEFEPGVVVAVLEEGRRLQVRGESSELHEFVLNPATARFLAAGSGHGARLELLGDGGGGGDGDHDGPGAPAPAPAEAPPAQGA
jgi:hypothetical protein